MRSMPGTENIVYHKKSRLFEVQKTINKKRMCCGTAKTLIQALMVRDWCKANNWKHYPKRTCGLTGEKYITQNKKGHYLVGKHIKGKTHYYGFFQTLEEAKEYRDFIVSKGWSSNHKFHKPLRNIKKTIHGTYQVYKMINGVNSYFGSYNSLEEAIHVRELVEKYNGDWDLIVEHDFKEYHYLDGCKSKMNVAFDKKPHDDTFLALYTPGLRIK